MNVQKFVEFSKPFVDATKSVFETMISSSIQAGKPEIKNNSVSRGDVSAIMGMSGDYTKGDEKNEFKGMLVFSFPKETYLKVASAMLMTEYKELNEEISDVGAEIANIVMGNAKRFLSEGGYVIKMSIPSTVTGTNHTIKYPEKTSVVIIPMTSAHGLFYMELCYQEL